MGDIALIDDKDLPEIRQDIVKLNETIEKVKNAGQFGKIQLAEDAMQQIVGLQVSMFSYLEYLDRMMLAANGFERGKRKK